MPPPAPVSVPAPQALPTKAGDSLDSMAPAPKKPEADLKAKHQAEKPAAPAQRQELQQQQPPKPAPTTASPPAPVPAEEKAHDDLAPNNVPAAGGAPYKDGSEGRAREVSIPEAERAASEAAGQEERKKSDEPKPAEQAPAKTLQRAPQPSAPSAPAGPAADKADMGLLGSGQAQKELCEDARFNKLLQSAKAKIKRQEYAGALDDLLAAQKIRDNKEIQDLILLCRSHLRGDG
jgi:hypothetical protein